MQQHFHYQVCFAVVTFVFLCLASGEKKWKLVWSDDFDGAEIDENKWTFLIGDGCNINLCGWGNNEMQWYTNTSENVYVENGRLVVQAKREFQDSLPGVRRSYTSAKIVTKGKADWKYARIEVRAKFPEGNGVWPIIWMSPLYKKYGQWPNSGEFDIAVMVNSKTLYMTAIYGRMFNDFAVYKKSPSTAASMFTKDFHNFVVDWQEDKITWIIDNAVEHQFTKARVQPHDNYPFNEKFYFIISLAVGGNVAGDPNVTLFPRRLEVDYIRVYQML